MAASFRGHSFGERGDGTFFPAWERASDSAVVHVPGGNTNIVQTFGRTAETLALAIYCSASELAALYGDVEQNGSLVYSYDTRTAFLQSISNVREIGVHGKYFATLNFLS